MSTDASPVDAGQRRFQEAIREILQPRVSGNVLPMACASVVGQVAQWLASILIANRLGAEGFGEFSFGLSVCIILVALSAYGMPILLVRDLAQGGQGRLVAASVVLRTLLAGGLAIVGGAAVFTSMRGAEGRAMWLILLAVPFLMAFDITSVLDAEGVARYEAYLQLIRRLLYLVFVGVLVGVFGWIVPVAPAVAFAGSTLVFVIIQWKVAWRYRPFRIREGFGSVTRTFVLGSPLFLSSLLVSVYTYADSLIIRWLRGPSELGVYSAASQTFIVLAGALSLLSRVLYPSICSTTSSRAAFTAAVRRAIDIHMLAMFAAGLGLAAATPWLVGHVLRAEYGRALVPMIIFACGLPILGAGAGYGRALLALGREGWFAIPVAIGAGINLLLNFLTVGTWGAVGAAWSAVASYACVAAINIVLYKRSLSALPTSGSIARAVKG